ncbi:MAG: hypothetical protein ACI4KG_02780 [Oscillospiraceae bacterium]
MKRLSILKKARLALSVNGILYKMVVILFPLIYINLMFDSSAESQISKSIMNVSGVISYGCMISMFSIFCISFVFSNIKFYKTLPMTKSDIVDIAALSLVFNTILIAVGQLLGTLIFYDISIMPYFLCSDCLMLGYSSLCLPWFMKDKYAGTNQRAMRNSDDDEKTVKKNTARVIIISLLYMAVQCAAIVSLIFLGTNRESLSENVGMLLLISGIGLLLFGATCMFSRKIKNAFEI